MVSPSQKRRAIKHVVEQGKGTTTEACRALELQRSTYYRNSTVCPERQEIERSIVRLSDVLRAVGRLRKSNSDEYPAELLERYIEFWIGPD